MNIISYSYEDDPVFVRDVGWTYDENDVSDNYVNFGIHSINHELNGYERAIRLDFNVDEPIIDDFHP